MADVADFWTDDGHSPINCEEFICALVRAKYRDGPGLASEENEAIREAGAELLRQSIEAAAKEGAIEPRGRDMLPLAAGISMRERFEPFKDLYFERESFIAFANEAWLVQKSDNAPTADSVSVSRDGISVEDLAWMIGVQRADKNVSHTHGLDDEDGLRRTIEIALQVRGWPPEGIQGVIPQIAELSRTKQITLHGPGGIDTPEVHEIAAHPGAWRLTADDAQKVLTSLCPSVRRYTVADAADILAKVAHPNDYVAEYSLRASLIARMEDAIQQGEILPNERRKDGVLLVNEYSIDEWLAREQIQMRLSQSAHAELQEAAMTAAGRLQIDDVASVLAKETGTDAARWESTLVSQIRGGALPLKNPRDLGDFLPYAVPKNLRTFYDRVDVLDVNKLLDANKEWRVAFRFAVGAMPVLVDPTGAISTAASKPLLRQRHQEKEILRVIRELGEDPKRLPKQKAGTAGVKAAVRSRLSFSESVFKKAWERLREAGDIADA